MKAISFTAARQNLASTMASVCEDHEPVIITSKRDRAVVMVALEDYKAMEETAYLLRAPKNARRLIESMLELENDQGVERELYECD